MVRIVALLNLSYFGIEFAVALAIGSVAPFADSINFLEDASVNVLIFVALGWSAVRRAHIGMALAGILLIPGLATLWTAWEKFNVPLPPAPMPLSLAGAGALVVNLGCAFMLARYRAHRGSLTRAAFLSARNDTFANAAIIGTGLVTAYWWPSAWPDLILGRGIAVTNTKASAVSPGCSTAMTPAPMLTRPRSRSSHQSSSLFRFLTALMIHVIPPRSA
jgi:Co/Zn/Cd efflux system component